MTFKNALAWFEIPTNDLERAQKFYESIFGCTLHRMDLGDFKMSMFPVEENTTGGALVHSPGNYQTGGQGPLIYLNASPDLQVVVDKIEGAGGQVLMPKTQITPEYGYMALFIDSEGNKIGLHSIG